jgi:hypothetical protein
MYLESKQDSFSIETFFNFLIFFVFFTDENGRESKFYLLFLVFLVFSYLATSDHFYNLFCIYNKLALLFDFCSATIFLLYGYYLSSFISYDSEDVIMTYSCSPSS